MRSYGYRTESMNKLISTRRNRLAVHYAIPKTGIAVEIYVRLVKGTCRTSVPIENRCIKSEICIRTNCLLDCFNRDSVNERITNLITKKGLQKQKSLGEKNNKSRKIPYWKIKHNDLTVWNTNSYYQIMYVNVIFVHKYLWKKLYFVKKN